MRAFTYWLGVDKRHYDKIKSGLGRGAKFLGLGALAFILLWPAPNIAAAPHPGPAQSPVCASLKTCQSFLTKYGPDSFDYGVLASEFARFGPAGQRALIALSLDDDADKAGAALDILILQKPQFSARDFAALKAGWPKNNLERRSRLYWISGGWQAQATLVSTLGHDDPVIASASRRVLDQLYREGRLVRPSAASFAPLAEAFAAQPSPGLASLVSQFASADSRDLLADSLRAADSETVIAAYSALYAQSRQNAFSALLQTLRSLKDNELEQALALSTLLRHRHEGRKDGFYLAFARDITKDPQMSVMGRMAGFDALLAYDGQQARPALPDSPLVIDTARRAAYRSDLPDAYWANLAHELPKVQSQLWPVFWGGRLGADKRYDMVRRVPPGLDKALRPLWQQALSFQADYRVQREALRRLMAGGDAEQKASLKRFAAAHPVSSIRANAGLKFPPKPELCGISLVDLDRPVSQMPFFETGMLETTDSKLPVFASFEAQMPALRYYLETASPAKASWLAGYDAGGGRGGLIHYITQNHYARRVMDAPVQMLVPGEPISAPGKTARSFWILSAPEIKKSAKHESIEAYSRLYRLEFRDTQIGKPVFVTIVPGRPIAAGVSKGGALKLVYDPKTSPQTPLVISNAGRLHAGCP